MNGTPERPAGNGGDATSSSRRRFLATLAVTLGAVGAGIAALPPLGLVLEPVLRRPRVAWRAVGRIGDFPLGETVGVSFDNSGVLPWDGVSARTGAWLRRTGEREFVAFTLNCTHLGCPVMWQPGANLFMCPCHGGVYDSDGKVAGGPPPRPLPRYAVRVRGDQVEIETEPIPIARAAGTVQEPSEPKP